jgi:hypothetical protein
MAETFKNYSSSAVGTTETTIYTVPSSTSTIVIGMTIANVLANTQINVDVKAVLNGSAVFLVKNATIGVGGALVPVGGDQKLVLEAGDIIKVTSTSASSADIILSVLEQTA